MNSLPMATTVSRRCCCWLECWFVQVRSHLVLVSEFAAARYAKALSHCAKFVDLNPEDVQEVDALRLTLNLNMALAYSKMEQYEAALRYVNDALTLDAQHFKALYRRASIYYELKKWEGCRGDIKAALVQEPANKPLLKLQQKVDAQLQRQKQKEKKMAQKMFG